MPSHCSIHQLQRQHLCRDRTGQIDGLQLPAETAAFARSLAGHIVAGVADDEEIRAFREFCEGLDSGKEKESS